MKINDLILRQVDMVMLFVFGFTFLIVAINPMTGAGYFVYVAISSIFLMFFNALNKLKEDKK